MKAKTPPTQSKQTITEAEFAAAVGLSVQNVRLLRRDGRLSHIRVNRRVLYTPDDVTAFLRAHRRAVRASA